MERTARLADDRFNELMGVLNATTARLVEVVGEFLDAGTWKGPEVRSAAHFVTWRLGVSRARANDLVAMARRRGELPACTAVFASGLITEDAMGVIARHLPAERDAEVAELAQQVTVPQLARILGTLPKPEPHPDDPEPPEPDDDVRLWRKRNGRLGLSGDISAERGALVQKALEAAATPSSVTATPRPARAPRPPTSPGSTPWSAWPTTAWGPSTPPPPPDGHRRIATRS